MVSEADQALFFHHAARMKKEDTGISARCLPEGRKCAVALKFPILPIHPISPHFPVKSGKPPPTGSITDVGIGKQA
jgi:hypothetical protein